MRTRTVILVPVAGLFINGLVVTGVGFSPQVDSPAEATVLGSDEHGVLLAKFNRRMAKS